MRKEIALALAFLTLLSTPAMAGGAGPAVGSLWGIIIIIIAAIVGFLIAWKIKK